MIKTLSNNRWKAHPWSLTGMVEEVSVAFLETIRNQDASKETDDLDGTILNQSELFRRIEKEGMRDPLLIVISLKHKTIRLEAGNHRVQVAKEQGYTHLPVATLIIQDHYLQAGNGTHYFPAEHLIDFESLVDNPYPYQIKISKHAINCTIFTL